MWGIGAWGATQWGGGADVGPCYDTSAPVIENFDPVEGAAVGRTDPVAFDVWDSSAQFAGIYILVRFLELGLCECAYNGISFESRYAAGSSKVSIADGFRFTVRRTGGWASTPIVMVIIAIDAAGNVTRREIGF